ncbi:MAG: amidohydrolase family protein [Myxococcota bacterium]
MTVWLALVGAAQAACTVITGAVVELPDGPAEGRTVVVVDDRIAAVDAQVAGLEVGDARATYRGQACEIVPAEGGRLTPGLVVAPSSIGLVEVGLEQSSRGGNPETEDPVRASQVIADSYDPLSVVIPVQRIQGITSALTVPSGGFVAGQAAFVRLHGATQAAAVVDRSAAMVMSVPTASFADGLREIRELVADVRTHARSPGLYDQGRPFFEGASRLDLEALRPVAEGKQPVLIRVDEASDLEALVRLKKELGLRIVVDGAAEGWLVADQLAAAEIPVMVDPFLDGTAGFDQTHARPDNAALLHAAGVQVILAPGGESAHNVRVLRQGAGNAVREGMPHDAALQAITSVPAAVFGQAQRGRIAAGAAADLVLWSGDPLELSTAVQRMWIGGDPIALVSRQTELRDKYRTLPGTPAPPLSLTP